MRVAHRRRLVVQQMQSEDSAALAVLEEVLREVVERVAQVALRQRLVSTLEPSVARVATEDCRWLRMQVAAPVGREATLRQPEYRAVLAMHTPRVALAATVAKARPKIALVVPVDEAALQTHPV